MDTLLEIVKWIVANYESVITALIALATGLIAVFMLIPGEQPEKFLQSLVDFLKKFSRK